MAVGAAIYGSGFLELAPKLSDNFSKDLEGQTESATQRIGDSMERTGGKLTKSVTLPLLAAGAGVFALAARQEEAEAKMTSSFESMGASAWTTTDALKEQAKEFQNLTTFGDEAILEFQAVMLTFGNVTGDVFTDATRLGLDMSAALGTDLQSSAIQLGKALNDPVQGVSALTRVGVSFTEEQKEMIKEMANSGDMAGAQAVIMGELEKQFGGTAEAMALTGSGQAKQAMNALGDAGESLGMFLLPVVASLAGWIRTLAERFQALSPEAQQWIVRIAAVAAAIGPVLIIGGKLIKSFGMIGKAFMIMSKIFMANPWILLIAAVIALVVIIVKNWDTIVAFLKRVWKWITDTVASVGKWFKDKFQDAIEFVKNIFLNFTGPGLLIKHWDKIKEGIESVVGFFRDKWDAVIDFFKKIPERVSAGARGMWDGIKNAFKAAINWIIDKWNGIKFTLPKMDTPFGTIGGGEFRVPQIPRLHDGGMVPGRPGQEMLAILEAGERVLSRAEVAAGAAGRGDVYVNVRSQADPWRIGADVSWALRTSGV